jgi:threonine dehydratase
VTELHVPTLADVFEARRRIRPYLRRTPIYKYESLSDLVGTDIWVKHENHQPIGAFKVRGGINLVSQLTEEERRRGIITASTGNHGQSIAFAARLFGVRAIVCVPMDANPVKVNAITALGAEIIAHGDDFDDARELCEHLAAERGHRYVHSGNEPLLIAGVATETLEIFEDEPRIDTVIVPIGGGSAAAGACIVAKATGSGVRVIGVQSQSAPAAYHSWKARALLEDKMETFAEGLASRVAFELPQRILWEMLDDFVLVDDDEIRRGIMSMITLTRNLTEGAGAAPLAAALQIRPQLEGHRVALICSGGNISPSQLRDVLTWSNGSAAL